MSLRRSTRISMIGAPAMTNGIQSDSKKRPAKPSKESNHPGRSKKLKTDPISMLNGEKDFKVPTLPSTPARKQRIATKATSEVPPLTPTPSLVNIIRAPVQQAIRDNNSPSRNRPVEPHITNATLITPGGTQQVAFPNASESTPSKTGLPRPTATTGTLLDQACAHLVKVDPRMKGLIEQHHCHVFSAAGLAEKVDPFQSLASSIMGQQVSGAAAKSIKNKFVMLFNDGDLEAAKFPTPAQVTASNVPRLRTAGLSERKAEYIHGLAQKFASGELTTKMLMTASDEEVMEKLIAVRGLGKWSVEMFACFGLKRLDILSTGDLGVQRGMAAFYGKDVKKLKAKGGGKWKYMSEQDMLEKSASFAPYRSLFMWYMWRVEDVDIDVMS